MVTREDIQATCDDIVREFCTTAGYPFWILRLWHAN